MDAFTKAGYMKCSNTLCSEWLPSDACTTTGCGNGVDPQRCLMNLVFKKLDSHLKNKTVDFFTVKAIWQQVKKNNLKEAFKNVFDKKL